MSDAPPGAAAASAGERRVLLGLVLVALGWSLLVAQLQLDRLARFEPRSFDLGIYAQLLWSSGRGELTSAIQQVPALAVHVSPLLLLLAPFTWLLDPVLVLVLAQALALGAQSPLVYLVLRRHDARAAARFALLVLLYPPLWNVALADVHPIALGGPLALLLAWALDRDRLAVAVGLALALGLLIHEAYPLVLVGLALTAASRKAWGRAAWLGGIGLACFAFVNGVYLPGVRGEAIQIEQVYGHLGAGPLEVVLSPVLRPGAFFAHVFSARQLAWLAGLLLPLALLPLLRPRWLLPALPILALQGLSQRATQQDLSFHYHAPLLPWLYLAAGSALAGPRGRAWVRPWAERVRGRWGWGVLGGALATSLVLFAGPRAALGDAWRPLDPRVPAVEAMLEQVPAAAPAAASVDFLAPLSRRRDLWGLPAVIRGHKDWSQVPYSPPPTEAWILADTGDPATFWDETGRGSPALDAILAKASQRWRAQALAPGRGLHALVEGVLLLGPGGEAGWLEVGPGESRPNRFLRVEPASSTQEGICRYRLTLGAPEPGSLLVLDYFDADGRVLRQRAWPAAFRLLRGWDGPRGRVVVPLAVLRGVGPRVRLRLWPPGADHAVDVLEIDLPR